MGLAVSRLLLAVAMAGVPVDLTDTQPPAGDAATDAAPSTDPFDLLFPSNLTDEHIQQQELEEQFSQPKSAKAESDSSELRRWPSAQSLGDESNETHILVARTPPQSPLLVRAAAAPLSVDSKSGNPKRMVQLQKRPRQAKADRQQGLPSSTVSSKPACSFALA